VSNNSFYRLPDNAELALAKRILNLAKQYAPELSNLTIDNAQIDEMEQAIETFNAVIAKPMDVITEKKQQTTNLAQLFAKLNSILYDKLDKIMVLYKENHEDFYNEYRTSRNLIITSVRHQDKVEN
jgi:F0F1-type ATP synthase delta subunit